MEEFRRQYAETGIMAWLEVLSRGGTVGDVDFLSTHPANEKRIRVRAISSCAFTSNPC